MRNSFTETWLQGTACMFNTHIQCCYLSNVTLYINFRLDMNMIIKVADFGLAVNTEDKDYYRLSTNMGVKLPVKRMAPESLANRVFSEMSDVVRCIALNYSMTVTWEAIIILITCAWMLLFIWV